MDQDLQHAHCVPCEGGVAPLGVERVEALLRTLPQWQGEGRSIRREFRFKNFYETMAFVNAVAWISHREDHHPELELGYNRCVVHYSTHAIGGLSENDFICAARVDALLT
ncbi:4a-hydroxytetrahydrobiopterin dehydratase [Acidithiobacillus sp.]